jgi:hypothetical protein
MDELAFRLILVALEALLRVDVLLQRNGVNGSGSARKQKRHHGKQNQDIDPKTAAAAIDGLLAEPDAMGEQSHTASERLPLHESSRIAK